MWLVAFRLKRQLDQSLHGHFPIHIFIAVMAKNLLESRYEDYTLVIGKVPLKGFVSEHGVANFLNVPYDPTPHNRTPAPKHAYFAAHDQLQKLIIK